jgi:twitching motility protein PilT
MQTFDQSLFHLYKSELITLEEALRGASNPDEFRLRIEGIRSTSDQAKEEMERIGNVSSPAPRPRHSATTGDLR